MKNIKIIAAICILYTISIACKKDHSKHQNHDNVFYTCSMDPQIKEDKPGKCPICYMELTPVKRNDVIPNEISLSEQQIKLGNISTQFIKASQGSLEQSYNGVLTIDQNTTKTISTRAMGRVEQLYFKTVGDYVRKNEPLYRIYSEEIAIAKRDYFTAYQQLSMPGEFGKNAKKMLRAAQQKLLFLGLSGTQIESFKTGIISPDTIFYSPYSGVISEVKTTEGSYIMEGSAIFTIADLKTLWLETQVNVTFLNDLKIGQTALILYPDFPGKTSTAKISFIDPEINPDTRLILIRLEVSNSDLQLKPGMQAIAKIKHSHTKGLFLPIDAVIQEQGASYIWIEKKHNVFEKQMVKTGTTINGMIEIRSAIDPSQKVVFSGAYAINSEYKLRKGNSPLEGMKM